MTKKRKATPPTIDLDLLRRMVLTTNWNFGEIVTIIHIAETKEEARTYMEGYNEAIEEDYNRGFLVLDLLAEQLAEHGNGKVVAV